MEIIKKTYWLLLAAVLIIGFFVAPKKTPSLNLSQEADATASWEIYRNPEYNFSFKYPETLLSNLSINTSSSPRAFEVLAASSQGNQSDKTVQINQQYVGTFEVNATKFAGSIDDYANQHLPETDNSKTQIIFLGDLKGKRISNINDSGNAYFLYNIFEKDGIIYNFSIVTDSADQIKANQKMLDDILSTVKIGS